MALDVRAITKRFGEFPALYDVSLKAEPGEFLALLGPSGSGKTTLLRTLAGLEFPDSGEVLFGGENLLTQPARERRVGMVFQHYALFRHMTVADNIAFGLTVRKGKRPSRAQIKARVRELLHLVQLEGLDKRFPSQLSGGQRQRVGVARALAADPPLLLMDEPFGALDAQTREEMQELLLLVRLHWQTTILFVTHDVDEAIFLSDRVIVMTPRPGRVRADLRIDLPIDRTLEQKLAPEFLAYKREITGMLHENRATLGVRRALLDRMFASRSPSP
jgi:sulfate transport system ATP-binding protein